jgi:hypothetical protein
MSDNTNEKNSPAYIENLWAQYKKLKGYDDGGTVQPDASPAPKKDSVLDTIGKALSKSFEGKEPQPEPSPTPSREDKYRKIREQNQKNFTDPVNNPSSEYYKPEMADGGEVRKSMAQRQNEDIQVLDSKTGKVKNTVKKYKSEAPKYDESTPEASPSPTPASSSDDEYQDDSSKPLMQRLKDYRDATDKMSTEDLPAYAMGGTADNQQPGSGPVVMDIPKKMADGGTVDPGQGTLPGMSVTLPQQAAMARNLNAGQNIAQGQQMAAMKAAAASGSGPSFQKPPYTPVKDPMADATNAISDASGVAGGAMSAGPDAAVSNSNPVSSSLSADPSMVAYKGGKVPQPAKAAGYKHAPKYRGGTTFPKISNVPRYADGGQVSGPDPDPDKEKSAQEKVIDILHRVTDPNQRSIGNYFDGPGNDPVQDLVNQSLPHYADGSGGLVEPDKFVDTQTPQEEAQAAQDVDNTGYAQEDYDAQKAAEDSTQGQIEQELAGGPKDEAVDEPVVEVDRKPASDEDKDEDKSDDDRPHREVILPEDTIRKAEALADVDPQDRTVASDTDTAAAIPAEGRSAAEQAQVQGAPSSLMDQLKAAQRKQSMISALQGIGEGGALVGAGLAGRGGERVTPVPGSVFRDANAVNLPMQHFMQQMQMDKEDPNSPISKTYQDHIIAGLGDKATPTQIANIRGSSANNLDKFLPQQTKLIYGQNAIQAKKDMMQTRIDASKDAANLKRGFDADQKAMDRTEREKIAAMAQEGMKQRFDTPTLDRITNEVRNDPLVKPVILKKASVDESLNLLDNAKTVHPALLSDANFAFTQAMNLQPGATTQKRYDASKITDLNQRVHSWVANNLNNPNADMREDDPALYNLLHGYLQSVSDDYGGLIDQTQSTVLNTKKAAYQALGRPGIVGGINAMQGALGNAGRGPSTQQQNGPAGQTKQAATPTITVRRKTDGKTKTLAAEDAAKYLADPRYEKVQ